jgi:hypothetical protein
VAHDAGNGVPALAQLTFRVGPISDGRPMDRARRRPAIRTAQCPLSSSGDVRARRRCVLGISKGLLTAVALQGQASPIWSRTTARAGELRQLKDPIAMLRDSQRAIAAN